jgi:isopropylmalate/homocitrate/citramalate synthase
MSAFPAIRIVDTTLRDGEQMPGVVFSPKQKIELAVKFSDFGIDRIEMMPAVSETERKVAKILCGMGMAPKLTASTMMRKDAVDMALDCGFEHITLFTPLSEIQLGTIGMTPEENIRKSMEMGDYALSHGLRVCFAGADVTRASSEYVSSFINSLARKIEYFMACDTLGCLTPMKAYLFFREMCSKSRVPVCLHEHNDFGLATANTLSGIAAGARMFSGTFTGIGERAGNAPIEEVLSSLKFLLGIELPVKYGHLVEICSAVEKYSGARLQSHKPIVGRNAFRHESGIHVDGLLKNARSYEFFDPLLVGQQSSISIGKHSGGSVLEYLAGSKIIGWEKQQMLSRIKDESQRRGRSLTKNEVFKIMRSFEQPRKETGVLYA